jgi:putative transposase
MAKANEELKRGISAVFSYRPPGQPQAGVAGHRYSAFLFLKEQKKAIERHEQFVEAWIEAGRRPEFIGGGLIHSLRGYSKVLFQKGVGKKVFSDEPILGRSKFVKDIITDTKEKRKENLRRDVKIDDLASLARKACEGKG